MYVPPSTAGRHFLAVSGYLTFLNLWKPHSPTLGGTQQLDVMSNYGAIGMTAITNGMPPLPPHTHPPQPPPRNCPTMGCHVIKTYQNN